MKYLKNKSNFSLILSFFTVSCLTVFFLFGHLPSVGDIIKPKPKEKIIGNKYMGAGSCASSNCHGAAEPRRRPGIDINQNEFSIWFTKDTHRKAFDVLFEPKSERIAKNLNLPDPADQSERCLVCHTAYAPAALWGKDFDFADGVSCESCHGPSEGWLERHTASDWTYEKSLERGMYDTKDVFNRAQICVSCHIGDDTRSVDHEMIASGHPDLNRFELDTFLAYLPPHWRKAADTDENQWVGIEIWGAGQTVVFRQSMEQLARRAENKSWQEWPEFAEFNCYSCHHSLKEDSWRQVRGYSGRTPGIPPWNAYRYVTLRSLANSISPNLQRNLDGQILLLRGFLNKFGAGGSTQISSTAVRIAEIVNELEAQLKNLDFGEELTYDLLVNVSGDAQYIANSGIRSAQQAALALETLFYTYNTNVQGPNNQRIGDAIEELLDYLEQPENFQPEKFISKMGTINKLLRNNKIAKAE